MYVIQKVLSVSDMRLSNAGAISFLGCRLGYVCPATRTRWKKAFLPRPICDFSVILWLRGIEEALALTAAGAEASRSGCAVAAGRVRTGPIPTRGSSNFGWVVLCNISAGDCSVRASGIVLRLPTISNKSDADTKHYCEHRGELLPITTTAHHHPKRCQLQSHASCAPVNRWARGQTTNQHHLKVPTHTI